VSDTASPRAAIASGGALIVYPRQGPHAIDLYASTLNGSTWGTPLLLTGSSSFQYHHDVAISDDGTKIVFDCGADPYGQPPTSICEVGTDGTGFRVVAHPNDGPDQSNNHACHHPDYAPDGSIVFEADYLGEQVWRKSGTQAPVRVSPSDVHNDNSPCVLPDGRIASLWLNAPGNTRGYHELKIMDPDGSNGVMVLTGQDIVDIGMGCSE
jgi:hypothetical protein